METALLIDIGSTFTKTILLDLEKLEIVAKSQSYTTVQEGVNLGLKRALAEVSDWKKAKYKLACSSAKGGLKLIAIGLVPRLTAEAAKRAALGAGSKVLKIYSYQLTSDDITDIINYEPDILLLTGGTDGGNRQNIITNAVKLAEISSNAPVIVAGNRNAAREVKGILRTAGKEVYVTENVMPELEKLNIEPARKMIRKIFLQKIIKARGLNVVEELIDGIIMPTPLAVMKAAELLADGHDENTGIGELMIIDVGGATTDVHSVASGSPRKDNVSLQGLQEPYVKRTVEGDLGMRYSLPSLFENIDIVSLKKQFAKIGYNISEEELWEFLKKLNSDFSLTTTGKERCLENTLAFYAVQIAVERHVGKIRSIYTPLGHVYIQEGKDLSGLRYIVGTGGIIVQNNTQGEYIASGALYKNQIVPETLAPIDAKILIDSHYILAAAGLLAEIEPSKSLQFMKKYFNLT